VDFLRKSPRYINPIILWIDLIIAELGFDDFWVFSIDCVSAMHGILELMILLRNDL
jgi:hypothetical protein